MSKRRVVVTGMGMLSPLGNSVSESWNAALEGKSGISNISRFDTENFNVKIGGQISDLEVNDYIDRKEARRMDIFMQYGLIAGMQAVKDASLEDLDSDQKKRIGVAFGSGIGGIETIETVRDTYVKSGPRKVSPFFVPSSIINMIAGNIAIKYGFKGPNIAVVTACTTGTHNIGYAARTIAYGDADVMIAGGAEMATTPIAVAGFSNAKALSSNDRPAEEVSRPWDKGRDGFVLSDGAGALVLEELEHAKARGATIYAELTGFGMSDDAFHITSPIEDGSGARTAMENAINDAGIEPESIDYINAHGTSTPLGDVAECKAIKDLFKEHSSSLLVSSTKSMTGHLLGAAGAIEAIFSVKAITDQVAPPTINLDEPEEGCDLDFVAHTARKAPIKAALSNSFGFGGTNGTLIFQALED
ncbi:MULTISPECIES: beta-ketoacyl-ACP synthase II [unclassified Oleiphilus]|nr:MULTISPECIES: beta-ketoacyl-ACP synthase II [unclassified Oleiphilus]KZY45457.1 beta-ketoacyl-ACP synthase II [Oleiphilus sp. HI0050]KZY81484.1 beta-ketoacyl-ACP synthase II [Oleiphilus sp. HI0068]KZY88238.1 beta-ketoacyl-ACP synthase II [Oleiphilus sp. HI0069]KZY91697.1 beta-ketoacyl-ACP synthase II [Oleiphilus sp. HI0072]KZZ11610.1 beta-ketoacyl-ACP synthase II [Oleiphilus sp. HI0078]KZZ31569.1 beta-ketoacyl-ACP synthase II [Oleiphilus sp. HI0085]